MEVPFWEIRILRGRPEGARDQRIRYIVDKGRTNDPFGSGMELA